MYCTTDWIEQNRRMQDNSWLMTLPFDVDYTCYHMPHIRHIFKENKYDHDDYLVFPHYIPFTQMLSKLYIFLTEFYQACFNTATIRVFQIFHYTYYGDCRILANGMWICHLEHHYHLTSILGRRPQPDYPRYSFRTHLHYLLLDNYQPHTMTAIWRCFIWTFCHCIKCSI